MVLPFLTIMLTQERAFSMEQAGWVMSCYGLGSVAGSYLGGWLSDRLGAWKVMFFSLLLSSPLFLMLLLLQSFPQWCLGAALLSMVGEAYRPALYASLGLYSKPENRTRSLSLVRLAINLGFSVGPAVGGLIAYTIGFNALFWIDGFTCLFAAILFGVLLQPKRQKQHTEPEPIPLRGQVLKDSVYLKFVAVTMLYTIVFMQLFSSIPLFFKQAYLLNESQIGALMALNGVLIVILEMPLIYSLENRGQMTRLIVLGAALTAGCYALFLLFPLWVGGAVLGILAISIGEIFNMPFANTLALNRAGERSRGEYMAWYSMSFSVAFVVAPGLGLFIADRWGFPVLWLTMLGLGLLATLGYLRYSRQLESA